MSKHIGDIKIGTKSNKNMAVSNKALLYRQITKLGLHILY